MKVLLEFSQDPDSSQFARDISVDEFLSVGGPSVVRLRLDSMDGNWRAEAKNGTIDLLDRLARLPGLQVKIINTLSLPAFSPYSRASKIRFEQA